MSLKCTPFSADSDPSLFQPRREAVRTASSVRVLDVVRRVPGHLHHPHVLRQRAQEAPLEHDPADPLREWAGILRIGILSVPHTIRYMRIRGYSLFGRKKYYGVYVNVPRFAIYFFVVTS